MQRQAHTSQIIDSRFLRSLFITLMPIAYWYYITILYNMRRFVIQFLFSIFSTYV